MRKIILATLFACTGAYGASADMTGNDLKAYCDFWPRHTESTTMCMGYINGSLDTFRQLNAASTTRLYCEPNGVTGEQLIAMTQKYLSNHPEVLHFQASSLILSMLAEAFPCQKR